MRVRSSSSLALAAVLAAGAALVPAHASAQAGSGDGFLFGAPRGALTLRAGFDQPRAGTPLLQEVGSRGDYGAVSLGGELSFALGRRVDLGLDVSFARSTANVAYNGFDEVINGQRVPIRNQTSFTRLPITANLRYYLLPRGESLSRFAWVPTRVAPYVGIGGGTARASFRQEGDVVLALGDWREGQPDPPIERVERSASSWTPVAHALAGATFSFSPRLGLTTEARYTAVGKADAQDVYFGRADRMDLRGVTGTVGLTIRY